MFRFFGDRFVGRRLKVFLAALLGAAFFRGTPRLTVRDTAWYVGAPWLPSGSFSRQLSESGLLPWALAAATSLTGAIAPCMRQVRSKHGFPAFLQKLLQDRVHEGVSVSFGAV
jgi:hypothetical protein